MGEGNGAAAPLLTADDIRRVAAAPVFPQTTVDVPELGGRVIVRSLSAGERDRFEAEQIERRQAGGGAVYHNFRARLLVWCLIDEDGALLFGPDDVEVLAALPARALQPAFNAAAALNAMTPDDVEELVADFGEARGSDGGSASR